MDASTAMKQQALGFGFSFEDLASREGLARLDRLFLDRLAAEDPDCIPACWRRAPTPRASTPRARAN